MARRPIPMSDPHQAPPGAPPWLRVAAGAGPEALAFQAGAALAALHPWVSGDDPVIAGMLLRERMALRAAERALGLAGRAESAAALRDEAHLTRPGARLGPGGALFDLWRRALRAPLDRRGEGLARLLPEPVAALLGETAETGETPVALAARVLCAALAVSPRDEAPPLIAADAVLARALGWRHALPLLAVSLGRGDLRGDAEALGLACHRAIATAAAETAVLAADLTRRAERLRAVLPKLRAKAAVEAARLFLAEDAVSPSVALSPVVRGGTARMSDRAARRFCDRLVALGVVRELTGRPSFRLYGL